MINVNFIGGARKSFQTDSLEITQNIETISELITYLISQKPKNTPDFDGKNLLIDMEIIFFACSLLRINLDEIACKYNLGNFFLKDKR